MAVASKTQIEQLNTESVEQWQSMENIESARYTITSANFTEKCYCLNQKYYFNSNVLVFLFESRQIELFWISFVLNEILKEKFFKLPQPVSGVWMVTKNEQNLCFSR